MRPLEVDTLGLFVPFAPPLGGSEYGTSESTSGENQMFVGEFLNSLLAKDFMACKRMA